jgi:hypothetical protein
MSQWAHITRNWEFPQAAPAWPVVMAAKQVNGRSWTKVPLYCVATFSVRCGLFKTETGKQQNMVDLRLLGLANSKHTACSIYHAPWFELFPDHCASWIWNSPSRRGLSSFHCGAPAVMKSGSHPENTMPWCDNRSQARQE